MTERTALAVGIAIIVAGLAGALWVLSAPRRIDPETAAAVSAPRRLGGGTAAF